ncbi:sulfatase family protein [Thaumasiovibrio subtropicus]|uniref:sulfatase family protein n=1 Tax=Thaumasiovibrio subtropicus TaxID=1891207 RepID=UPI000B357203|nr:sulfatase [Thaumasiovibrio subtropicus]
MKPTFLARVLSGLVLTSGFVHAEATQPNILYIMSDDHAVQALSAYGHPISQLAPTPNIDRIAQNGALFTRSYVTNSLCGPSRAAMLTGKFGHENGFMFNGQVFDGTQPNWPNTLQRNGYTTAMIGKWHINRIPNGFEFDHWDILNDQGEYYNPDFITPDGVTMEMGYTTDLITEKTLTWLDETRDKSKPFALLMHHKAPHRNWMPAPRHTQLFEEVVFPLPDNFHDSYAGRKAAANQSMTIAHHTQEGHDLKMTVAKGEDEWREDIWPHLLARLTDEQREAWDAAYRDRNDYMNANEAAWSDVEMAEWKYQRYMQDYLATIVAVDESVGAVLDYLEEADLLENTLVVYTSDQGFFLGEHGFYDKRFMYEESFSTPLVMQLPGVIAPGTEVDALVQNIDYAPTFLQLAGMAVPEAIHGRSLLPLLTEAEPHDASIEGKAASTDGWRDALYYHYYEYPGFHDVARHYGVFDGRYKLIHFYNPGDDWEFYDLETDPSEMHNAINDPQYHQEVARLRARLAALQQEYRVAPIETWRDAPLERVPNPSLESLFPESFQ